MNCDGQVAGLETDGIEERVGKTGSYDNAGCAQTEILASDQ